MKKVYADDLAQFLGEEIQEFFYLQDLRYSDNLKNKWQTCVLADKTGKFTGTVWSQNMNHEWSKLCGSVVRVTARVEVFRDMYGMNIFDLQMAVPGQYDLLDYQQGIALDQLEILKSRFWQLVSFVIDPVYDQLLHQLFDQKEEFRKYCELPGSKKYHHAYRGGWLEQTVMITELCLYLASHADEMRNMLVPDARSVDLNLLITGGLLHDIGKLNALKAEIEPRMTKRGYLIQHVIDSEITVALMNARLKENDSRDITELLHMIASADETEDGVQPQLIEAMILRQAKTNIMQMNAFYTVFAAHDFNHPDAKEKEMVYSKYFGRMLMRGEEKHV